MITTIQKYQDLLKSKPQPKIRLLSEFLLREKISPQKLVGDTKSLYGIMPKICFKSTAFGENFIEVSL